jgi:hypothetical protein
MADFNKEERIKLRKKIKSKRLFVTGSSRSKGTDTFLTSSWQQMSKSFADNEYLDDSGIWETQGAVIYQLQQMQEDITDIHSEISQSVYVSSVSEYSNIATASIGIISSSLVPNKDNAYDLGSSTKEWKNLYVDGTAYIDSLAGTTLTAPIRTVINQVTAMKTTTLDAQQTDVFEFNIAKAVTIDLITPMFPGQEITIMNIGSGAITVTRSAKGKSTSIFGKANLTINQNEAYKFVVNSNQIWYVIS